jgi:hypothetical protein
MVVNDDLDYPEARKKGGDVLRKPEPKKAPAPKTKGKQPEKKGKKAK